MTRSSYALRIHTCGIELEFGFGFLEENWMMLGDGKEELVESGGSGSEQMIPGGEQKSVNEPPLQQTMKKRYHRHTARQIQQLEALFKESQHPDDNQRMRLSHELGLKPRKVKFWFQNRFTQMKAQQDRSDNVILRAENENLKNENYRLPAALSSVICTNCGEMALDDHRLRLENARLKDEIERICCLASRYDGPPMHVMPPPQSLRPHSPSLDLEMNIFPQHIPIATEPMTSSDSFPVSPLSHIAQDVALLLADSEKPMALELAVSFVDELVKMSRAREPLWIVNGKEGGGETLDFEEYSRLFHCPSLSTKNSSEISGEFRREATRDSTMVIMNSINLVDAFLDANKWMELFPSIVARAKNIQAIVSGDSGNASGSLRLMYAELQVLSPLVPSRETYFLRYCQQNVEEGSWAVVDFPMNGFHDSLPRYRRRPSGCVIEDMPNGYSRVSWVEHAEIEEKPVYPLFSGLVESGTAFGARRWLSVLQRQCERVASLMARNISDLGVIPSPEARQNLMRLSERIIRTFSINIGASGGQSWTALSDSSADSVRITTRKITEAGQPNGVVLAAVSTTWLPYLHQQVLDLLKDERRRAAIDVFSNGNYLQEVAHIANGSHPGNRISLLRIAMSSNLSQRVELMLQESCTDPSGSLVVCSNIDVDSIQLVMSGGDPSCIPLLPIGLVMVPTSHTDKEGCLLTVCLQVLESAIPTTKLNLSSVKMIHSHLCNAVHQINAALGCPDPPTPAPNLK